MASVAKCFYLSDFARSQMAGVYEWVARGGGARGKWSAVHCIIHRRMHCGVHCILLVGCIVTCTVTCPCRMHCRVHCILLVGCIVTCTVTCPCRMHCRVHCILLVGCIVTCIVSCTCRMPCRVHCILLVGCIVTCAVFCTLTFTVKCLVGCTILHCTCCRPSGRGTWRRGRGTPCCFMFGRKVRHYNVSFYYLAVQGDLGRLGVARRCARGLTPPTSRPPGMSRDGGG